MANSISALIRLSAIIIFGFYLSGCSNGGGDNGTPDTGDQDFIQVDVSGSLEGLRGMLVLDVNGESVTLEEDGSLSFTISIKEGDEYTVAVEQQPDGQICSVEGGSGTFHLGSGIDLGIVCESNTFTVSGDITLTGAPISLKLGDETIEISESGPFQFSTPIIGLDGFEISVIFNPAIQTCSIENNTAESIYNDVDNVIVTCSEIIIEPQPISVEVTGTVSGLRGTLTLGVKEKAVELSEDGALTFTLDLLEGEEYVILINDQPNGQVCALEGGSGVFSSEAGINIAVSCTSNTYSVGGNITLFGSPVSLTMGDETIEVSHSGSFQFNTPVVGLDGYDVTVDYPKGKQHCVLENEYASAIESNVSDVDVTCREVLYKTLNDGVHGFELWRTDGTEEGTQMVVDAFPGENSSFPFNITPVNDLVYFLAVTSATSAAVMVTDGSDEGTHVLATIPVEGQIGPEILSNEREIKWIAKAGDRAVFLLPDPQQPVGVLWGSDGTVEGTHVLQEGVDFDEVGALFSLGNKVAYLYDDGEHGYEWWITDGVTTEMLADLAGNTENYPFVTELGDLPIIYALESDGYLLFLANNENNIELWGSDGSAEGTKKLVDQIDSDSGIFAAAHYNDQFYYVSLTTKLDEASETNIDYLTVWQVNPDDPTAPKQVAITDQGYINPFQFFGFKDNLYLVSEGSLYKVDLNTGGISLAVDLWDTDSDNFNGFDFFDVNKEQISLVRVAYNYSSEEMVIEENPDSQIAPGDDLIELVQYDGEQTQRIVAYGIGDVLPLGGLDSFNDGLFLFADDEIAGVEPHFLANGNLTLIKDVHKGTLGAQVYSAITIGEQVFAVSQDSNGSDFLTILGGPDDIKVTFNQEGTYAAISDIVAHQGLVYFMLTLESNESLISRQIVSVDGDGKTTFYDIAFAGEDLSDSINRFYSVSGRLFFSTYQYRISGSYRYKLFELSSDQIETNTLNASQVGDFALAYNLTLIDGDTFISGSGYNNSETGQLMHGLFYYKVGESTEADQVGLAPYPETYTISNIAQLENGRVMFSINRYSGGQLSTVYEFFREPNSERPFYIKKLFDFNNSIRGFHSIGEDAYFVGSADIWTLINNELFSILPAERDFTYIYEEKSYNGGFYFRSYSSELGYELYFIQKIDQGNFTDPEIIDIFTGRDSSSPSDLFLFKDYLYFFARSEQRIDELWRTDGSAENTEILLDQPNSIYGYDPRIVDVGEDNFIFVDWNLFYGRELWISDGTKEGTRLLGDIGTRPAGSFYGLYLRQEE